jgi:hypothetical protein
MPAGMTYTPLARTTLVDAQATVVFSSIAQTYTDLVLVMQPTSNGGDENVGIRFNGDTGANYSYTRMGQNNTTSSVTSNRSASFTRINATEASGTSTNLGNLVIVSNIFNYANATTFKTVLNRSNSLGALYNGIELFAGSWRNTNAINSITVMQGGTRTFLAGSTFTLYGILAA